MSIFGISVSGLLSNQASISTTSHNIANASTEGYSRQRAVQTSRTPQFIGGNYFGTGVELGEVERIFEAAHQLQVQANTSDFNRFQSFLSQAERVDNLLSGDGGGINQAIQKFFSAVQSVANDPASTPGRQVLLSEAENLVSRFQLVHSQLEKQITEINSSIQSVAEEVTALANSIANLNNRIASSPGGFPPDLLDQRDREIERLSELVAVQTIAENDGSFNVFIGTGQALVVGSTANNLTAQVDTNDPRKMRLSLAAASSLADITENIKGGKLEGLLEAADDLIESAFNTLGRVAVGIAESVNQQHQLGIDLNNQLGGNFFTDVNDSAIAQSRVISATSNTGNATISLTIDSASTLTDTNYRLFFSAGNYQLIDSSDNSVIASFAPPAVVPDSVQVASEGFTINFLSGAAAAGDSFTLQPTRNFSQNFQLQLTTPRQIAAASPIRAQQASTNIGSASIAAISVSDTSTAQFTTTAGSLTPPIRIQFDATPGEFSIYDMSTGSPVLLVGGVTGFVDNQQNDMLALAGAPYNAYGYEITLDGDPQPGDSFDVNYNTNGFGDNSNIALLGELQFAATLNNGNANFQQAFGQAISSVGVKTSSAEIKMQASEGLLFQSKQRRESISGVNLDEEAANLIKFQQAYQASAQVISVARTLFQTVIDSFR